MLAAFDNGCVSFRDCDALLPGGATAREERISIRRGAAMAKGRRVGWLNWPNHGPLLDRVGADHAPAATSGRSYRLRNLVRPFGLPSPTSQTRTLVA